MIYETPVLILIEAKDEFHHNKQLREYLTQAFREFAATYNVVDHEILDQHTHVA